MDLWPDSNPTRDFLRKLGAVGEEAVVLESKLYGAKIGDWKTLLVREASRELLQFSIDSDGVGVRVTFVNPSGNTRYTQSFSFADVQFVRAGKPGEAVRFHSQIDNQIVLQLFCLLNDEAARVVSQLDAFKCAVSRGRLPIFSHLRPLSGGEAQEKHGLPGTQCLPRSYYDGFQGSVGDIDVTATRIYRPRGERLYLGKNRNYSPIIRPRREYSLELAAKSACQFTDYAVNIRCETDVERCSSDWQIAKRAFVSMRAVCDSATEWKSRVSDAFAAVNRHLRPLQWAQNLLLRASTRFDSRNFERAVDAHYYLLERGYSRGLFECEGAETVALQALSDGTDQLKVDACAVLSQANTILSIDALGKAILSASNPTVVRSAMGAIDAIELRSKGSEAHLAALAAVRTAASPILLAARATEGTCPDQLAVALRGRGFCGAMRVDDSVVPYPVIGKKL